MTQSNGLGISLDCHERNIHTSLATANDENILSNTKLFFPLEFRRVDNLRNVLDAFDERDVGSGVQAGADCYCIAIPRVLLSSVTVKDGMATLLSTLNLSDGGIDVDMRFQAELSAVGFEVLVVGLCRQEVGGIW